MTGRLRQAIESWIYEKAQPTGGPGYFGRVRNRYITFMSTFNTFMTTFNLQKLSLFLVFPWTSTGYILFGFEPFLWIYTAQKENAMQGGTSQYLADLIHKQMSKEAPREIVEMFGALITEPVLALFEQYAGKDNVDPKEFARAFHGFMISLNVASGLADTVVEGITAGQVEGAGRMISSMYWSLGLGFLGWQTLAPLLEGGLQPGLRRYYQNLYRPMRFTAGDLRDLYALGEIGDAELKKEAAYLGWRNEDIAKWIKLAYRNLGESDIFQAFHEGNITEQQATARLRALGYNPTDIPLLYKLNPPKAQSEAKEFSASTARQAYRNALIGKAELLSVLKELNYSDREANVIVQLEDLSRTQETKSLAVGQINAAWEENVITDPEAIHWLDLAGFEDAERTIILSTWKAKAIPEYRKLNLGTITGAYVEGIINRSLANEKLLAIGLKTDDAKLELDLVEKRNPEAFGVTLPALPRRLTPGQLADMLEVGLINASQMAERVKKLGYSDEDARLLTDAALARILPASRPIPQYSVERAYVAGVIDRTTALSKLAALGISTADGVVVLDTLEKENPEAFGLAPKERARQLSASAIEDLRIAGLITSIQMKDYLLGINYTEADIKLLVARAEQLATPYVQPLSEALIERAYLAAVIDRTTALEKLANLGITREEGDLVLTTLERENPTVFGAPPETRAKELSASVLEDLRLAELITSTQMKSYLIAINYSEADAALLVARAEQLAAPYIRPLTEPLIERAYSSGIITRQEAKDKLLGLAFAPDEVENILTTIDTENAASQNASLMGSSRVPSIVALAAAVKNTIIDESYYYTRALELGYTVEDATMYLVLAVQEERKATEQLSVSQIASAYDAGIVSWSSALSRILARGYSDEDARLILRTRKDLIENTDVWYSLNTGDLNPIEALNQLVSAGYADEDIYNAFAKLTPSILEGIDLTLTDLKEVLHLTPGGE